MSNARYRLFERNVNGTTYFVLKEVTTGNILKQDTDRQKVVDYARKMDLVIVGN